VGIVGAVGSRRQAFQVVGSRTGAVNPRGTVSSPRHIERSVPISSTPLSCPLHGRDYATEQVGNAVDSDDTARAYSTFTHRFGLPHAGYPLSQVLQIAGRFYHSPLPPLLSEELRCSRVPLLPGNYPSSLLLRTHPPPSRRPSLSRLRPVIGRTCSRDFSLGRGGLLQLLDMPLPPCCP
jgi:hypothetical protein